MTSLLNMQLATATQTLAVRALKGVDAIGEPSALDLDLLHAAPLGASLLGLPAGLSIETDAGQRWIPGVITRFSRVATSDPAAARRYRARLEPTWALLRHRRNARVFQHVTIPDLIKDVLVRAGYPADRIDLMVAGTYPEREYLVQRCEDDLTLIRRLCEEEGLYLRAIAADDGERIAIEDTSSAAPVFPTPLQVVDATERIPADLVAWAPEIRQVRRAGKVTLRDHNPDRPAVDLSATASAGTGVETDTEVYLAPGRFRSPDEGDRRARLLLESLRADSRVLTFHTNAISLTAGTIVKLEHAGDYPGAPAVEGEYFITAISLDFDAARNTGSLVVTAVPRSVPFRLPRITPRPRIHGVEAAVVTGRPGAEIHPDAAGRVFVHFFWDREGPTDDKSSLPVRVLQPNMPGSMAIPRVGWEVAVAFEDGDPDRPYVLGRVYNAKSPPPVELPANKTMTMLRTWSSPGGGAHNTISFDDAAGRQHMAVQAGFGKSATTGNDMLVQTAKVEKQSIGVNQTVDVGADDALTVKESHKVSVGSQTASVGSTQDIFVNGHLNVAVGSETVLVGGALLEKVGNPVTGLQNLGVSAALAGAGALGGTLKGAFTKVAVAAATSAAGVGLGMYQASQTAGAGPHAARDAGIRGVLGAVAGLVPGGSAVFASVTGRGTRLPWEDPPPGGGSAEAGGGAGGGASDSAGAQGPGPGHRNELIKGPYVEAIGGAYLVTTPGSVMWQTTGASAIVVGGTHSTTANRVSSTVLGASIEALGSMHIKTSAGIGRSATSSVTTNIAGSLSVTAGGQYSMSGAKLSIHAGGPLTCTGGVVAFIVGSVVVAISSSGLLIHAPLVKIQGASTQSGDTTH